MASYVVMFGPIFCTGLSWRRGWQIAGSELAAGSLVPASGAAGLALGAWVLHRGRHERGADRAAFGGVLPDQELGELRRRGRDRNGDGARVGPDLSLWLTAVPAVASTLALGGVVASPGRPRRRPAPGASRRRRAPMPCGGR